MTDSLPVRKVSDLWRRLGPKLLPFADAASAELPLSRLLRLSLFQISVGVALVLLNGTLNRVMIVELGIPAWLVATMIALPILAAPFRALIGFRSDHHRSGARLAPRAVHLDGDADSVRRPRHPAVCAAGALGPRAPTRRAWRASGGWLSFLMVGAGLHTSQTAGVALATDLAPPASRPRVVALLYVMLLIGMVTASLSFGGLLRSFSYIKLIQIVQGRRCSPWS